MTGAKAPKVNERKINTQLMKKKQGRKLRRRQTKTIKKTDKYKKTDKDRKENKKCDHSHHKIKVTGVADNSMAKHSPCYWEIAR